MLLFTFFPSLHLSTVCSAVWFTIGNLGDKLQYYLNCHYTATPTSPCYPLWSPAPPTLPSNLIRASDLSSSPPSQTRATLQFCWVGGLSTLNTCGLQKTANLLMEADNLNEVFILNLNQLDKSMISPQGHWALHAYGILAITELRQLSLHLSLLTLVPLPALFYILTARFGQYFLLGHFILGPCNFFLAGSQIPPGSATSTNSTKMFYLGFFLPKYRSSHCGMLSAANMPSWKIFAFPKTLFCCQICVLLLQSN